MLTGVALVCGNSRIAGMPGNKKVRYAGVMELVDIQDLKENDLTNMPG